MDILDNIVKMDFLDKMLGDGIKVVMYFVSNKLDSISGIVAQSPDTYNPAIWKYVTAISEHAVLPFAYIFLSLFLTMEVYEIVQNYNNTNVIIPEQIFKVAIKAFIGISLVDKVMSLLLAMFNITNRIVFLANFKISGMVNPAQNLETLTADISKMKFIEKLVTFTSLQPSFLLLNLVGVIIQVLVIGRFIEIYVYTAIAPLPISIIISRSMGSTGKNFLKNYAAVCLQGVFYILIVGMYGALVANTVTGGGDNLTGAINNVMIFSGLLVFALLKSGSWVRNVIGG